MKATELLSQILKGFSYVFHPIFVPIMAVAFHFYIENPIYQPKEIILVLLQTILITLVAPLTFFALLYYFGKVNSLMVADVNQRKIPLIIQSILFFFLIHNLFKITYFYELYFCFLASIISILIAFVLLFARQKISLHMIGISGLTTFVILSSIHNQTNHILLISLLVLSSGAVASSRLLMKAHTPQELIFGTLAGSISQLAFAYFWI